MIDYKSDAYAAYMRRSGRLAGIIRDDWLRRTFGELVVTVTRSTDVRFPK